MNGTGGPPEGQGQPPGGDDDYPITFPVVALIASAGGLDALSRVLAPLPTDLPAAILVALHRDPREPDRITDLLSRDTRLEVQAATDHAVMRPGVVFVAPPGRHLLVTSRTRIGLIETGAVPPNRPSADLLLSTLAVTCGRRALAVILTGMGHDGQARVRAIAHCGGTVIAQDQATASYFGMPSAAIDTHDVSQILALDDIPAAIIAHTTA